MKSFIPTSEVIDLPIPEFLERLGYYQVNRGGASLQYHSMLRETHQHTPSFSVWLDHDGKWQWKDWGGANASNKDHGNIIDLALAYWHPLPFLDVLHKIRETFNLDHVPALSVRPVALPKQPSRAAYAYTLDRVEETGNNFVLWQYLGSRGIADVADGLLKEVYYRHKDQPQNQKPFYAVGWLNEHDNWEFCNARGYKSSIGAKGVSVIPGDPARVIAFEGIMDYLSCLKLEAEARTASAVILNSASNLGRALELLRKFPGVAVYFDNDNTGRQSTHKLMQAIPGAEDRSETYRGYKDYNEKLQAGLENQQRTINPWEADTPVEQYYSWYRR